jgi:phosphocarrier protein FPr/phosphocarrier protein
MSNLILLAPLAGWCSSLEEAPDPVFSGRMLGDGVLIDPTSATVVAPCDGEVVLLPGSKHAVALRSPHGLEVLIHVGIDTVGLDGEGFEQHVRLGAHVLAGEPLISFDMDALARRAKSLLTPVIVTESRGFSLVRRSEGRAIGVGDWLMELAPGGASVGSSSGAGGGASSGAGAGSSSAVGGVATAVDVPSGPPRSPHAAPAIVATAARRIVVPFEHGIHARPAALLANSIKPLSADARVTANARQADARSTAALMALGVRRGDEILVEASGTDARAAVDALASVIVNGDVGARARVGAGGRASDVAAGARVGGDDEHAASATAVVGGGKILKGVVASRGLATGRAFRFGRPEVAVAEEGSGVALEQAQLQRARTSVAAALRNTLQSASSTAREIITAHLELLDDPQFIASSGAWVAEGKSAGWSWRAAIRVSVDALRDLRDARMAERIDDLLDLEAQVLLALSGASSLSVDIPTGAVLVAQELLPSHLVSLDAAKVAGICMAGGGPTSHAAILAAAMGIPAVVALGAELLEVRNGTSLIVDADAGLVHVDPAAAVFQNAHQRVLARRERRAAQEARAGLECRTADGTRIEVFANAGSLAEAEAAVRAGAEGCGLLRTEFLFLHRTQAPTEDEQAARYQEIATAFAGRPVIIRTLDIGGDKPIPYLPLPHEDNPALGLRGVRTSLWNPQLLRTQLLAILRVQPVGQCQILLPMITDAAEVRAVRSMLEEVSPAIRVGAMIETPAAAMTAATIARDADFLSIGTNDLTQYALAMDRGHAELAARLDALHPAVLRLIAHTTSAARARSRPVAVCGGLAAEPLAVPVLIGLGVEELSVVPSAVGELKALIATLDIAVCRELAREALELESAEAVRDLVARRREMTTEVVR